MFNMITVIDWYDFGISLNLKTMSVVCCLFVEKWGPDLKVLHEMKKLKAS